MTTKRQWMEAAKYYGFTEAAAEYQWNLIVVEKNLGPNASDYALVMLADAVTDEELKAVLSNELIELVQKMVREGVKVSQITGAVAEGVRLEAEYQESPILDECAAILNWTARKIDREVQA